MEGHFDGPLVLGLFEYQSGLLVWSRTSHVQCYLIPVCGPFLPPLCGDCHSVALEMHNTFVENVVVTWSTSFWAISMARFVFRKQLCIPIACDIFVTCSVEGARHAQDPPCEVA